MKASLNAKALTEVGEELDYPGFRDRDKNKGVPYKVFWVVFSIFLAVLTIVGVQDVFRNYYSQPTTTSISVFTPNNFPPMMYCMDNWVDGSVMKEMAIDSDTLVFLVSFFPQGIFSNFVVEDESDLNATNVKFDFYKRYGNSAMDDVLKNVSHRSDDVIPEIGHYPSHPRGNDTTWIQLTRENVCYALRSTWYMLDVEASTASLSFYVNSYDNEAGFQEATDFDTIYFGMNGVSPYPEGRVYIHRNHYSVISLKVVLLSKVSTRRAPCGHYREGDHQECILRVINEHCRRMNKKEIYMPGIGQFVNDLSNYWEKENHCFFVRDLDSILQEAGKSCRVPCNRELYEVSVYTGAETQNNHTLILVNFVSPTASLAITEALIYPTLNNLVSNLGGAVSLWTGVSLVTAGQVLTYFLDKICTENKSSSTAST